MPNKTKFIKTLFALISVGASFSAATTNAYADAKESDQSLEDELLEIVAYFQPLLPKRYKDGTTTVVKVEARGHVFTYHYVLDTDWAGPLLDDQIAATTRGICNPKGGVWPYIKKGAHIEHSYTNRNGQFLGSFGVNLSNCG
ncbi:hypothetical protein K3X41_11800 [Aliiroseovarius crassostreae]|uniref:hypothetical protein n=1 Tax=Aliiroseovarius crassostreae TaxID=154981 RepID=UPI0022060A2C|nr:hypothetical protein [Aliiroseovarius crassostreae]UWQ07465.1 hypothetical protein K3X25_11920 [Aliiroseovarius crassostreae]UWQ10572.1 hypothetical protein K3X41_11800 [Aliiroseovarius crassostreae]